MSRIPDSELIVNEDGSVFHLHVSPGQLATTILLVGDPARVDAIATRFDSVEFRIANREFTTITGSMHGQRLSVVSTGIGCDNIDIVITEIDAVFNVDFQTREVKSKSTVLNIIRLGTSGAVNPRIKIGDILASEYSVGLDGLAYFYDGNNRVRELQLEDKFITEAHWNCNLARPYIVRNDEKLLELFDSFTLRGTTVSAGGFYGPQGRVVRLALSQSSYLSLVEHAGIDNFEMEGSAIAFLGRMLGHRTLTLCAIIAQRVDGDSRPDYKQIVDNLIDRTLECLIK